MKKPAFVFLTAILALVCVSAASADHHSVKTVNKDGVGDYLTDAKGMTLYWFVKDQPGVSACSGGCLEKWPVYYRETVVPPEGVLATDFSTMTRADGQKQTNFRGYPLYYFFKDEKAGETKGQAANNVWYVIDPGNFPNK